MIPFVLIPFVFTILSLFVPVPFAAVFGRRETRSSATERSMFRPGSLFAAATSIAPASWDKYGRRTQWVACCRGTTYVSRTVTYKDSDGSTNSISTATTKSCCDGIPTDTEADSDTFVATLTCCGPLAINATKKACCDGKAFDADPANKVWPQVNCGWTAGAMRLLQCSRHSPSFPFLFSPSHCAAFHCHSPKVPSPIASCAWPRPHAMPCPSSPRGTFFDISC